MHLLSQLGVCFQYTDQYFCFLCPPMTQVLLQYTFSFCAVDSGGKGSYKSRGLTFSQGTRDCLNELKVQSVIVKYTFCHIHRTALRGPLTAFGVWTQNISVRNKDLVHAGHKKPLSQRVHSSIFNSFQIFLATLLIGAVHVHRWGKNNLFQYFFIVSFI